MNKIYLYDDNFHSLIILVVELIKLNIIPDDIKTENSYIYGLFDETLYLKITNYKENIEYLKSKLSRRIIMSIYYVYLSENKNKELIIYNFIRNALIYKDKVFFYRNKDCVNDVIKISKYVANEKHKLIGFLRFKEMKNNFLYAQISPKNNVIRLISLHFKHRLPNLNWIIKDKNRGIFVIYYQKKIVYLTEKEIVSLNLTLTTEEEFIEDLWKTFFKTVAIKERENLKCQRNFMPKRYWENMIEMEDKL